MFYPPWKQRGYPCKLMIRRLISFGLFSGAMFVSGSVPMFHINWLQNGTTRDDLRAEFLLPSIVFFFQYIIYIGRFWTNHCRNYPRFVWGVLMRPGTCVSWFFKTEEACLPWKLWIHEGRLDSGGWYTRTTGSIKSIQMNGGVFQVSCCRRTLPNFCEVQDGEFL